MDDVSIDNLALQQLNDSLNKIKVSATKKDDVFNIEYNDEIIEVPPAKLCVPTFLNTSVILYGGSGSGKTNTSRFLIKLLSDSIPLIFCFCPTNSINKMYTNVLPDHCIYEEIDYKKILDIYYWQEKRKRFYLEINNLENLTRIMTKLGLQNVISSVHNKSLPARKAREEILRKKMGNYLEDAEKIESAINKHACESYKIAIQQYINSGQSNPSFRLGDKLDELEARIANNLYLNPNIMIIFDDCTSELEQVIKDSEKEKDPKNRGIIKNLFTKGRHFSMTIIVCSHSPPALKTEIRNNARYSILGSKAVALSFLGNTLKNDKSAAPVIKAMFDPSYNPNKYTKIMYDNIDQKWYHITAPNMVNVKVVACSPVLRKYCEWRDTKKVKSSGSDFNGFY